MEVIGIQTRIVHPPKDDLYTVFEESISDIREEDILLISSKVLAIHQGRCVPTKHISKEDLILLEADHFFSYHNKALKRNFSLTIKGNTLVSSAGIDESNGNGYYILWPENSTSLCREIQTFLREKYHLKRFAVIAVDSQSVLLRYGAIGVGIGYFGMHPLKNYIGKKDLFERPFVIERSNMIDMIASAGTLVMGEGSERVPLALVRGVSGVEFSNEDTTDEFFVSMEEDKYAPFFDVFPKK
ncbi:MAG: coenzyme F420-0:L-glutamate ligase [Candidatus Moraniibacteriota bacterium]|nr:MAG: coenzyme F420-0:L-glutamate ligase [Candidatus Moranbacteria bacterium]